MFYAAVEMRDNPAYRKVPIAVGGMAMISVRPFNPFVLPGLHSSRWLLWVFRNTDVQLRGAQVRRSRRDAGVHRHQTLPARACFPC